MFKRLRFLAAAIVAAGFLTSCGGSPNSTLYPPAPAAQGSASCATSTQSASTQTTPAVVLASTLSNSNAGCTAFLNHSIIVQFNGSDTSLGQLLKLNIAGQGGALTSTSVKKGIPEGSSTSPSAAVKPPLLGADFNQPVSVIAYHLTRSGHTNMFHGFAGPALLSNPRLQQWIASEQNPTTANQVRPLDAPSVGNWIPEINDTIAIIDGYGNATLTVITYYKLYEHNQKLDYFMVAATTSATPAYQTCNVSATVNVTGQVGWYMDDRLPGTGPVIQNDPSLLVNDHGPGNVPSTSNASLAVGTNVSTGLPSFNATYTQTWSQPDVKTDDNTVAGDVTTSWSQQFASWNYSFPNSPTCPPTTSTSTFSSPWSAIYQIADTKVPAIGFYTAYDFVYDHTTGSNVVGQRPKTVSDRSEFTIGDGWQIAVPLLQICTDPATGQCAMPYNYKVPVNKPLSLTIGINNGSSQLNPIHSTTSLYQPAWQITNVPSWLNVSQLTGVGTTLITLTPQPNTAVGSVATLNVDTNPPGGTPELEKGPLVLTITATAQ